MSTIAHTPTASAAASDAGGALAERTLEATVAAMELVGMYLGDRLGLYDALARGAATAGELAERTDLDARYVREWLEQQAAADVLHCEDPTRGPDERRFTLPPGHDEALLDPESLVAVGGFVRGVVGILGIVPRLLESFRTGAGIPYADYGDDVREGIADMNRPMFARLLGRSGCPPSRTSTAAWRPATRPVWPTSHAAAAGPASPSPGPIRPFASTASTRTPPRSPARASTPPTRGSRTGSTSSGTMRRTAP
jgi:hypothetical protein